MGDAIDETEHRGHDAADQPVRSGRNGLKHGLRVRGRTGNNSQNVGACRLPLQRFLGLVEEARVLDGDNGLVCETLLQTQLFPGKWQYLITVYDKDPNGFLSA